MVTAATPRLWGSHVSWTAAESGISFCWMETEVSIFLCFAGFFFFFWSVNSNTFGHLHSVALGCALPFRSTRCPMQLLLDQAQPMAGWGTSSLSLSHPPYFPPLLGPQDEALCSCPFLWGQQMKPVVLTWASCCRFLRTNTDMFHMGISKQISHSNGLNRSGRARHMVTKGRTTAG